MRLIHLTDPHLSSLESLRFIKIRGKRRSGYLSWVKNRRHIHRPEVLECLTRAIEAEGADQILLTGDLVQIGLECEMIEAAQWLQQLGPPGKVMLIPGNHDNYAPDSLASMNRHWGNYLPDTEQSETDYTFGYPTVRSLDGLQIIGLNSSCTTRIFSAAGRLGARQQDELNELLKTGQESGQFQLVLIHHPPFPDMTKRRKALRDDRLLEKSMTAHPPDLVLYGHLHRDREHIHGKTHIYCTASASSAHGASYRVFDLEQTGHDWHCHMRLMTLPANSASSENLVITAQSSWSVAA
jgi:3',5'-cyclic AMP phosphodiesterase CpdA